MARNYLQASQDENQEIGWHLTVRSVLWWTMAGAIAVAAWYTLLWNGSITIIQLAVLAVIFSGLAFSMAIGLEMWPVKKKWRYRLAFLLPAFFGMTSAMVIFRPQNSWFFLVMQLAILLSSFVGSVAATAANEKIWENNSPPPDWINQEVEDFHRRALGPPARTPIFKRGFDICMAAFGLVLSVPVWLVLSFLIWFENPGPLLFVKNSVGKGGKTFRQFKFRTMVCGAEVNTGPILSSQGDKRILWTGRFLRKTALDELPQLINILVGEMSFVGPRPQRTVLVHEYLAEVPGYAERHRVLPGLSGLAQVAGDYYLTPHQKLRLDRLYIAHTRLGFDLKLLLLAFLITFWYRWKATWNGKLPRKWLHPRRERKES